MAARASAPLRSSAVKREPYDWPVPIKPRQLAIGPLMNYLEATYGVPVQRPGEPPPGTDDFAPAVLSQVQIARILGVHQTTVGGWMRGRSAISVFMADRIARTLGVFPTDIWGQAWWDVPDAKDPYSPRGNDR